MIGAISRFENRDALARMLAARIARALSKSITAKGSAVLFVSGGTTPALMFEHLSRQPITWEKVTVSLVDERQVPEDNPRSNAALVRKGLLQNAAAASRFVPLHGNVPAARQLVPDCVVLGMGEDGHTASFFPGGDRLAAALDPVNSEGIIEINAPGAGEPRLTFTLAQLLKAATISLHIEGDKKRAVLEKALAEGSEAEMPVRSVLRSTSSVDVYWCP